jgi:mannose-6-phosphate isomerase-like protein (cupin superfamily)
MQGYIQNIEQVALENAAFRAVQYTGKHMQLVVMSLRTGEDIGEEVHTVDQFFRCEAGAGTVEIDDVSHTVTAGDAFIVPAGATHNVRATGEAGLKLYTIYAPPQHADKTVHTTKQDAEVSSESFTGGTTE